MATLQWPAAPVGRESQCGVTRRASLWAVDGFLALPAPGSGGHGQGGELEMKRMGAFHWAILACRCPLSFSLLPCHVSYSLTLFTLSLSIFCPTIPSQW